MAITSINIQQDNKYYGSDLIPIHSPAIFLINATWVNELPDKLMIDIYEGNSKLATYKCIPYADIAYNIRQFAFIANSPIKGLMDKFDDILQTAGTLIHIPEMSKTLTLKFYSPLDITIFDSVTCTFIHGSRQFGEMPNLRDIYNNEPDIYYGQYGHFAYAYFYNSDASKTILVAEMDLNQTYNLTFDISEEDSDPINTARIQSITTPSGQTSFDVNTNSSGIATLTGIKPGYYKAIVSKSGFVSQVISLILHQNTTQYVILVAVETPYLTLIPETINISKDLNATVQFAINSNIAWTINVSALTYFSLNKTSGTGNDIITATVLNANSGAARSQTFHLLATGFDITGTILQAANTDVLSVSANALSIGSEVGNTITFDITSNIDWVINTGSLGFATSNHASGNGNQTITLTVNSQNLAQSTRQATIYIQGGIFNIPIVITQAASIYYLRTIGTNLQFAKYAGLVQQFTINANVAWQIVSSGDIFAYLSQESGSAGAVITVTTFLQNDGLYPKTQRLTITSANYSIDFFLYQLTT